MSLSDLSFGSTETATTGSGKVICSSIIGWLSSQIVWPVDVSFSPTAAAISPALTLLISSLSSACIFTIRPIRSFLPVIVFSTPAPASIDPEYTLK